MWDVYVHVEAKGQHSCVLCHFYVIFGVIVFLTLEFIGFTRLDVQRISASTVNLASAAVPGCILYTSDAAYEARSVDLGGRRII